MPHWRSRAGGHSKSLFFLEISKTSIFRPSRQFEHVRGILDSSMGMSPGNIPSDRSCREVHGRTTRGIRIFEVFWVGGDIHLGISGKRVTVNPVHRLSRLLHVRSFWGFTMGMSPGKTELYLYMHGSTESSLGPSYRNRQLGPVFGVFRCKTFFRRVYEGVLSEVMRFSVLTGTSWFLQNFGGFCVSIVFANYFVSCALAEVSQYG